MKTGFEFRLEFSTRFLQGNSPKFGQKWTENRSKFHQTLIRKKSMNFGATQFSVLGNVRRQMWTQWGVGGNQF